MAFATDDEELGNLSMPTESRRRVNVLFRSEIDIDDWRAANARGERPDATPYGLHRIAEHGFDVAWDPAFPVSTLHKLAVLAPQPARSGRDALSLAWDEHTALRMQAANRPGPQACGVIWATDGLGDPSIRGRLQLAVMRRVLRRMTLLWCLSRAQLAPLADWLEVDPAGIRFIRFGIDTDFFTPGSPPATPMILSLGNDQDRDPQTLLRAFSLVRARLPDVQLRLQSKADFALPEGATRVPHLPHAALRDEYARASVVAVATRPNLHVSGMTTVLEGMASARPVVLSDTPGAADYVADDHWGYRAAPGDPQSLAEAMIKALDPETGARLGAAGRRAAEEGFSSRHMVAALAAALHETIDRSPSVARLRHDTAPTE
ncbi:glycosyltransferase family 4 protein [Cryobacterium sp. BB307]|uniref:glycosyltransferase family 4 protein n=1 Tax=Cryobacterium sp. BB307 TaxID=2716317 RepID=UPI0014454ADC|nr:glycosyltransferase family 4 protein [Cryobacterium sp. BB307]